MALHISIDVDDTIVTPDDLLIEGVREVLEVLHGALDREANPRFRLQLWSTAGHERARDMARRHNLERFFESFATKPDVAVDDKPVSTHPSLVLEVNSTFSLQDAVRVLMHERFEAAIDAVIEKESPLLATVKHLQARAVEKPYAELRPAGAFFPIPFFGNPRTAKLITVGLNPAITEFKEWRHWPEQMTSEDLLLRLTGYFASTRPRPHRWFSPIQEGLSLVGKSYGHSAAHVDVSPWPTYSTKHLAKAGLATQYHSMIESERQSGNLVNLLKLAPQLQHVVILQNGWMPENLVAMLQDHLAPGPTIHVATGDWTQWFWNNRPAIPT